MSEDFQDKQKVFNERLKRYQATIALEVPDRMPVSAGSNYFAEVYAGYNKQQAIYDTSIWADMDAKFIRDFPEVDNLRPFNRHYGPLHDAVGFNMYKLPGRELSPNTQYQFVEGERMKEEDYDLLIKNPDEFLFERFLPRTLNELSDRGSLRSYVAILKGGMTNILLSNVVRARHLNLQKEHGMPLPMQGGFNAPFDMLADGFRGLKGIMTDLFRRPDKVLEACEALIPISVNNALANADPLRRYPIFVPLHRGNHPFLSPKKFDEFYWPSLKKTMMMLIDAGYIIRAYLEGDWDRNIHHMLELPKGKLICDIDNQGDIFLAKQILGGHQCFTGGLPDSTLILGSPMEVRERVKLLCETVGKDGGYIVNGGCSIPYDTKPENYRAMIDAIVEYGRYGDTTKYEVQSNPKPPAGWVPPKSRMFTPWEVKQGELGEITGDESLLRENWEMLEKKAYSWLWSWKS